MKKDVKFNLPKNVSFIISKLNEAGFRADIVGGSVRNLILGIEVSDYDITTSALPEDIKRVFFDMRTVDTGIKHGTVTLIVDNEPYEITTYRLDGEYRDNRHPVGVTFSSSLEEDLARRDFTVNAMCYCDEYGITDIYGGIEDARNGIIRAVGVAEDRFDEDGLRILRALRFASVLGFEIEENTDRAIRKKKELIKNISAERIFSELKKFLSGRGAYAILAAYPEVISVFLPELRGVPLPRREVFNRLDGSLRLLLLFTELGEKAPDFFEQALIRLKSDKAMRTLGKEALYLYKSADFSKSPSLLRLLGKYSKDTLFAAAELRDALGVSVSDKDKLAEVIEQNLPYKPTHLKINGNDLVKIGAKGREVGNILDLLLCEVIDGKLANDTKKLLERAKQLL